jgi:DNA-binding CsgD family transcriptional regulator
MGKNMSGLQDAQKRLRSTLLDRRVKGEDVQLRSACAEMLLDLGDQERCWSTFVDHLLNYADCDRVDAGPCQPDDDYYIPFAEQTISSEEIISVKGLSLPNRSNAFQWVWHSSTPFLNEDVSADQRIDTSLVNLLEQSGSKAIVSMAIRYQGVSIGLVCLDQIQKKHAWNLHKITQLQDFIHTKAAPILAVAGELAISGREVLKLLSPAELRVAQLAVTGASYKSIARQLNKSFSTVDHQLRSVRAKLNVQSHPQLVGALRLANLRD